MESESLERKLEEPDWKQWLPVYGLIQTLRDIHNGKPTILENSEFTKGLGFFGYQVVSPTTIIYGIRYGTELAEKLF
jgi:hypothetical protein